MSKFDTWNALKNQKWVIEVNFGARWHSLDLKEGREGVSPAFATSLSDDEKNYHLKNLRERNPKVEIRATLVKL